MCKSTDQNYRVKMYGEVFTPPNIVKDMCDLIKEDTYDIKKTFFEPACGDGAFLKELLTRKLQTVQKNGNKIEDIYTAVSSIYGVDIQADNVEKSRKNMLNICKGFIDNSDVVNGCKKIINVNIVHGNTLPDEYGRGTMYGSASMRDEYILMFYEWEFGSDGYSGIAKVVGEDDESLSSKIGGNTSKFHLRGVPNIRVSKNTDVYAI